MTPYTVEDDPTPRPVSYTMRPDTCHHPDHQPPTMIVVPAGKRLVHVCEGCGKRTVIRGRVVFGVTP